MKKINYSAEELELISYVENKNPKSIPNFKQKAKALGQATRNKSAKKISINLKLLEEDLKRIKKYAIIKGLPYQTLLSSAIHKYTVENRL